MAEEPAKTQVYMMGEFPVYFKTRLRGHRRLWPTEEVVRVHKNRGWPPAVCALSGSPFESVQDNVVEVYSNNVLFPNCRILETAFLHARNRLPRDEPESTHLRYVTADLRDTWQRVLKMDEYLGRFGQVRRMIG